MILSNKQNGYTQFTGNEPIEVHCRQIPGFVLRYSYVLCVLSFLQDTNGVYRSMLFRKNQHIMVAYQKNYLSKMDQGRMIF